MAESALLQTGSHTQLLHMKVKVVGKAQAMKSNLHNFRYRCLAVALIDVKFMMKLYCRHYMLA